jgi:membrane protein YqaA with SNARE-associated domain
VAGTFLFSLVGAVVPVLNAEIYLAAVAAFASPAKLVPVVLAATLGQVLGKIPFYLAGRGVLRLPVGRYEARVEEYRGRFERSRWAVDVALFSSASWGVPPFLVGPYLAGFFDVSFARFLAWSLVGRALRFAVIVLVPVAVKALAR